MLPFKVSIDKEYKQLMNDVMKFLTLLVVVNIIMYMSNPSENVLFGSVYTKLIISILLGVSTYWLVIDKLIIFD
jgi:hypothetical protein